MLLNDQIKKLYSAYQHLRIANHHPGCARLLGMAPLRAYAHYHKAIKPKY